MRHGGVHGHSQFGAGGGAEGLGGEGAYDKLILASNELADAIQMDRGGLASALLPDDGSEWSVQKWIEKDKATLIRRAEEVILSKKKEEEKKALMEFLSGTSLTQADVLGVAAQTA